jgi:hypothetical protein
MRYKDFEPIVKSELDKEFCFDKVLYPALRVAYKRKYFEGSQNIRVTLDDHIKYYKTPLNSKLFISRPIKYPMTIMEIKFHPDQLKAVSSSFKDFHLVPKRHSKYLVGMSMLGNAVYI